MTSRIKSIALKPCSVQINLMMEKAIKEATMILNFTFKLLPVDKQHLKKMISNLMNQLHIVLRKERGQSLSWVMIR